jgi:Cytochrome P450
LVSSPATVHSSRQLSLSVVTRVLEATPVDPNGRDLFTISVWSHRPPLFIQVVNSHYKSVPPTGYLVLILNDSVSTQRLALEDFTFSNGVRIPKGTMIQGVATPVHLDSKLYSNPDEFQPFRFFSDDPDVPKKDMTTISLEFLPFSYGRNAWCVVHIPIVFPSLTDSDITMFHFIALVGGTRK